MAGWRRRQRSVSTQPGVSMQAATRSIACVRATSPSRRWRITSLIQRRPRFLARRRATSICASIRSGRQRMVRWRTMSAERAGSRLERSTCRGSRSRRAICAGVSISTRTGSSPGSFGGASARSACAWPAGSTIALHRSFGSASSRRAPTSKSCANSLPFLGTCRSPAPCASRPCWRARSAIRFR